MSEGMIKVADYFRKVPVPFLVAFGTALALVLFLPEGRAAALGVDEFRAKYRLFIGPTLIAVIAATAARGYIAVADCYLERRSLRCWERQLHSLTAEEKGYLFQFMAGQNTVRAAIDDGIMAGLDAKNIVYRPTNIGDLINGFPYNLQPWARDYLETHPELLEGHRGHPQSPRERLLRY